VWTPKTRIIPFAYVIWMTMGVMWLLTNTKV